MSKSRGKYSAEFKESAAKEVVENSRSVAEVARQLGVVEQTLGSWVRTYRDAHPQTEEQLTLSERARLRELERRVRELQIENEFLGKSVAFFAKTYR